MRSASSFWSACHAQDEHDAGNRIATAFRFLGDALLLVVRCEQRNSPSRRRGDQMDLLGAWAPEAVFSGQPAETASAPFRSQRPAPHFCHAAHWYPASMPHPIRSRATPWKTIVLVCGKCARKLDGGYGPEGKDTLRSTLRAELKGRGHGREVRIIETRCMGICPKKAVTMVNASKPGTISVVPKGTPIAAVMAQIIVTP